MIQGTENREQRTGNEKRAVRNVIRSHKDLTVWKKGFSLALDVYRLTSTFPPEELYGLTSQMRRAAFSIPANIAEGSRRRGNDYARFLRTSAGSASELETYLLGAQELGFGDPQFIQYCLESTDEVLRMLHVLGERVRVQ
ncbi:MAG: S23 ribosomal protein [Parcubacteria group bacterium Gr01-1014_106]|nr:MAG: S23 ribosomal protein [Parcubacteria group bacterium Gr01-1014_106]